MDADTILVLGGRGLLGRAVLAACPAGCRVIDQAHLGLYHPGRLRDWLENGHPPVAEPPSAQEAAGILEELKRELVATGRSLDSVHSYFGIVAGVIKDTRPKVVINCTGYTDVDLAEAEPELAMAVNAEGASRVAKACAKADSHMVHISTDYVFDGNSGRPYREDDEPRPISVYGKSKLAGEQKVARALPGALIVRTAWLFGPGRPGFVEKVVAKAEAGEEVSVVSDEVGSPTYTHDLAEALLNLARREVGGVLHVVNQGQASRFEQARQALRLCGHDPDVVKPLKARELGLSAARPAYSVLDTRRYARLAGSGLPTWLDALGRYLNTPREETA